MEPETVPVENLDLLPDEILLQIMLEMTDLKTLNSWCLSSYRAANLCRDEGFWKQKYQKDYPKTPSLPNVSWQIDGDRSTSSGRQSVPSWKEKYEFIRSSWNSAPISAGFKHYAIIDDQGMLYMGGDNTHGQWGLGHVKDLGELSTISPFKQRVRSVSCCRRQTFAVTEDGDLYFWGTGCHIKPKRIDIPEKAIKVSCGAKTPDRFDSVSFAVIMENRFVYFRFYIHFDSINPDNIIESPNYSFRGNKMIEGTIPIKVVDISVGGSFSLVSTEGKLYFWGGEMWGSTLIGIKVIKNKIVVDPVHIPLPEPIKKVSHGGTHIGALSIKGDVYLWGTNYHGQLGQGFDLESNFLDNSKNRSVSSLFVYQPQKLKFPDPIAFLNCQMETTSAISTKGKLYMWGSNRSGSIIDSGIARKIPGVTLYEYSPGKINPGESLTLPVQIEIGSILSITPSDSDISMSNIPEKDLSFLYVSVGKYFNITTTDDGMVNLTKMKKHTR